MIDAIAALGDSSDINCWSGIPWHFGQAARAMGELATPWPLDLAKARWPRRWWNLLQFLRGKGLGGYQYSRQLLDHAEAAIPPDLWRGTIITFNQHFPRARSVAAKGAKLAHYVDATFASFCSPGGLAERLPRSVREQACSLEREDYAGSERVVTMARWAAESVIHDCQIPPEKVFSVLPGASLELPEGYEFPVQPGDPGADRPLVLGFVGKEWERKGLPFLLDVREILERMGVRAVIRCAGNCPENLRNIRGLEYVGFINKATDAPRFVEFLATCDVGCLFSTHEPLGISTLEFLRAGIPVAGFTVEGLADTLPPDAGFRFPPGTTAEAVAIAFRETIRDMSKYNAMRASARAWSPRVTWQRCVVEWLELLRTGSVQSPVQPWLGMGAGGKKG